MKLDSPKQLVPKSPQQVFDFLNDLKNFEKLMPDNVTKFELLGSDGFLFALKGMPEVALKRKEAVAPKFIQMEAAGGKLNFNLNLDINEVSSDSSEVQLTFNADFNAMMAMMVKGPITKMIETWVRNIPKEI